MFASHLTISQKGLILVFMPLFFSIVFTTVLIGLIQQSEQDLANEIRAKETIAVVNELVVHMVDATTALAGYRLKKDEEIRGGSEYWMNRCRADLLKLKGMIKDNREQGKTLNQLQNLLEAAGRDYSTVMNKTDTPTTLSEFVDNDQIEMLDSHVMQLANLTESLLIPATMIDNESPIVRARNRQRIEQLLVSAVFLNVLLTIGLAFYFSKNVTERLKAVKVNTSLIGKRLPLNKVLDGIDEIAALDKAFHNTASELERIENAKQEMVEILSHELKTPLTSVQSIFYLAGQGAFGDLPEPALQKVLAAERQSGELILIINDLLALERQGIRDDGVRLRTDTNDAEINQAMKSDGAGDKV